MRVALLLIIAVLLSSCVFGGKESVRPEPVKPTSTWGYFSGPIETRWEADGRTMTLLNELRYTDPKGVVWIAPAGSRVDGASIPRALWSFFGGPFEGKFRNASVLHDVAYDQKSRPWQQVDRMFYDAMRCSGVGVGPGENVLLRALPPRAALETEENVRGTPSHRGESGRGRCDPGMGQAKRSQPGSDRFARGIAVDRCRHPEARRRDRDLGGARPNMAHRPLALSPGRSCSSTRSGEADPHQQSAVTRMTRGLRLVENAHSATISSHYLSANALKVQSARSLAKTHDDDAR